LITVACGALPGELIESELFGHAKGAFTSAHAEKEGKFVAAKGGTILLDEIDVLTPKQQVKLLRVIESGEFEPVGSNETIKCRARLVVASNLELQPLVEVGKFRADLYYRLNMLKFDIVPLRSRREDITPLAHKFVTQLTEKYGVTIDGVDRSFYVALNAYPWPGNVRELENVVQRAVIYARDGKLTAEHLPRHILTVQAGPTNDASVVLSSNGQAVNDTENQKQTTLGEKIENTEREIIQQTLLENSFNRTKTARELGVSRVTLYNKMKKYGIA
jgi:DNA-binding NtrC family response regulator